MKFTILAIALLLTGCSRKAELSEQQFTFERVGSHVWHGSLIKIKDTKTGAEYLVYYNDEGIIQLR